MRPVIASSVNAIAFAVPVEPDVSDRRTIRPGSGSKARHSTVFGALVNQSSRTRMGMRPAAGYCASASRLATPKDAALRDAPDVSEMVANPAFASAENDDQMTRRTFDAHADGPVAIQTKALQPGFHGKDAGRQHAICNQSVVENDSGLFGRKSRP